MSSSPQQHLHNYLQPLTAERLIRGRWPVSIQHTYSLQRFTPELSHTNRHAHAVRDLRRIRQRGVLGRTDTWRSRWQAQRPDGPHRAAARKHAWTQTYWYKHTESALLRQKLKQAPYVHLQMKVITCPWVTHPTLCPNQTQHDTF